VAPASITDRPIFFSPTVYCRILHRASKTYMPCLLFYTCSGLPALQSKNLDQYTVSCKAILWLILLNENDIKMDKSQILNYLSLRGPCFIKLQRSVGPHSCMKCTLNRVGNRNIQLSTYLKHFHVVQGQLNNQYGRGSSGVWHAADLNKH
jgi:hypothetical protein